MRDEIKIERIEVVYRNLYQIDIRNETTSKSERVFIEKDDLQSLISDAEDRYWNQEEE